MEYPHRLFSIVKYGLKAGFVAGAVGFVLVGALFLYYFITLPSLESLSSLRVAESTKILDRTGEVVLYDVHGEYRRTIVPLENIPLQVVHATIAAEDANFYHHFGIDAKGILRSMIENIRGRRITQGGSTITQQFIKNAFLSSERTYTRKIKEAILAIELEIKYSKDQIMELYLNQVPYGSNAYGTAAAAQVFFGKTATDLTLAESATLAALPQAPTYYSPYGSHPEDLMNRKDYVLFRMNELGYISDEEYETAKEEEVEFISGSSSILAPHFVFYVLEELEKTYGKGYLQSAGLEIKTTLDWDLQSKAQELTKEQATYNETVFGGENASVVVLDPKEGHILAMVGSRDYFEEEIDGNVNVAIRPRQPGSSFKPFVYAKAFEKGYSPDTIVFDAFTEFNPNCSSAADEETDQYGLGCYHPQNYTETFSGPITLKEALAQSVNVPSVKTLYLAGMSDTLSLVQKMGIQTLKDPSLYGLSLVLGGGEVTLLEEAAAYGVFATSGVYVAPQAILSIKDSDGKTLFEYSPKPKSVLDKEITDQITAILSSNELRSPVFGLNSYLNTPNIYSAAKTGTTQNYRDAWTLGYTNDVVVGVWAGNNNGDYMVDGPGASVAAPLWRSVLSYIYEEKESTPFPISEEPFEKINTSGIDHSILYYRNMNDDSQFGLWEDAIYNWKNLQNGLDSNGGTSFINNTEEGVIKDGIVITLASPEESIISASQNTVVEILFNSTSPLDTLSVSFDDKPLFIKQFHIAEGVLRQSIAASILPLYTKQGPNILHIQASNYNGETRVINIPFTLR